MTENSEESKETAKKKSKLRILVADDERGARMALEVALRLSGYDVTAVEDGRAALEIAGKNVFDLLITDVYMPGIGGLELIKEFRRIAPQTKIIVVTGQGSVEIAMQAVAQGAFDFIAKPFNIEEVIALVGRATENNITYEKPIDENDFSASGIIGHSPQMIRVYKLIAHAARNDSTVLVEGETGTGKEVVARTIHKNSDRALKPFTAVNCSALTETLLESELFGYVKGSFTGAMNDRAGLFESTSGGTIFLDEISSASLALQASLLRVLQEKEIRRVGSSESRKINVRVIAASNSNLEELVEKGEFRADLFYRLSVLAIPVPSLRERGREDLELLVRHFLRKNEAKANTKINISTNAIEKLAGYEWTGNVRELENALEYACAVCSNNLITENDFPARIVSRVVIEPAIKLRESVSLADDRPTLEELSHRYAALVLAECDGNKSRAAEILGINRRTLYRYLNASDESGETAENFDENGDSPV